MWKVLTGLMLALALVAIIAMQSEPGGISGTATECIGLNVAGIDCSNVDPQGCELNQYSLGTATGYDFYRAYFDSTNLEYGTWQVMTPPNMTGTTGTIQFAWLATDATCDGSAPGIGVCWGVDAGTLDEGQSRYSQVLDGTADSILDNCEVTNGTQYSPVLTFTHGMEAGKIGDIKAFRDPGETLCDGTDDLATDAILLGALFCYEVNNVFSGEGG